MDNEFLLEILSDESVKGIASVGTYFVNPNFYYNDKYIGDEVIDISNKGLHNFLTNRIEISNSQRWNDSENNIKR